MKIAIPIESESEKSLLSAKFARSNYFAIVDKDQKSFSIKKNPFYDENSAAGRKLFHWLTNEHNVDTLLAYELGLNMQQLASESHMQIIIIDKMHTTLDKLLNYMQISLDKETTPCELPH